MRTYFAFMHSMTARVARVVAGLSLVLLAGDLLPGAAIAVAALGTAVAVTGIGDICPMEIVVNARRTPDSHSQRRAA
jgi:hypothetical protein